MADRKIVETTEEARQGETSGRIRWVLGISLVLAILVGGAIWAGMIRF